MPLIDDPWKDLYKGPPPMCYTCNDDFRACRLQQGCEGLWTAMPSVPSAFPPPELSWSTTYSAAIKQAEEHNHPDKARALIAMYTRDYKEQLEAQFPGLTFTVEYDARKASTVNPFRVVAAPKHT